MMDRFNQLGLRERIVLGLGVVLAILIVGWTFVWSPLQTGSIELRQEVEAQARLLVDLRRAANLRGTTAARPATGSNQSLMGVAEDTRVKFGLPSFTRLTNVSADELRVTFKSSSFDALIDWMVEIERQHGVRVSVVRDISASGPPGLVDGEIYLSRS